VSRGLAYFIAKTTHSCSNGFLDDLQRVKPMGRASTTRNVEQICGGGGRGERTDLRLYHEPQVSGPSVSREVVSLCGVKAALPRLSLSFWIMSVPELREWMENKLVLGKGMGQKDVRKGGKIERERREWGWGWQVEDDEWCNTTAKRSDIFL
jgi:hypothetical protein